MTEPLAGSTVLITGGAGFIGSHLAERLLLEKAKEIRILDDFSRGRLDNLDTILSCTNIRLVRGDVRDRELVRTLTNGCTFVFHFAAWRIHRCESEPRQAIEVMTNGTYNVFEAAAIGKVKKVIFASSASVYGQATEFPTSESCPPYNNSTLYGWAKLYGEGLARWFYEKGHFSAICLRFFNVYGPRMDREGKYTEVMIRWLEALSEDRSPVIHGDGSASYDFVHVNDVIQANILAVASDISWGIYNVASGRETNLNELASLLIKAVGKNDISPHHQPSSLPPVHRRWACLRKIRNELGYQPTVNLETGLKELVEWYRSCKQQPMPLELQQFHQR